MSNWQHTTLGAVARNVSRPFNFSNKEEVVFVNTGDVLGGEFLHTKLSKTSGLPGQAKKAIENGDILFSEIRPANRRFAFVKFDPTNYVVSTKFMVIKGNEQVNEHFLYLLLTLEETMREFQQIAEARSGTFPQITFDSISGFKILLPPLGTQQEIVGVVGSIDNKIELLRAQNRVLEEIMSALFNGDFAGDALDDKKCLSDYVEHYKKQVNPSRAPTSLFHHYSIPAFDNEKTPQEELGAKILSNKYQVAPQSVLFSKLNPRTPRVWVVFQTPDNAICSTEFQVLIVKDKKTLPFVYSLLRFSRYARELSNKVQGTSSSHQRLRPEDILNIEFPTPDKEKLARFCDVTLPLLQKVESNENQLKTLIKLRNVLLPELLSGELEIKV